MIKHLLFLHTTVLRCLHEESAAATRRRLLLLLQQLVVLRIEERFVILLQFGDHRCLEVHLVLLVQKFIPVDDEYVLVDGLISYFNDVAFLQVDASQLHVFDVQVELAAPRVNIKTEEDVFGEAPEGLQVSKAGHIIFV